MTAPYYVDEHVTLYHGDCLEVTEWLAADVLITDPPYPNNADHFTSQIPSAIKALGLWRGDAIVFWSEIERPPIMAPLVAVHIWHRPNVNGKPYEPAYHFAVDGKKKRSELLRQTFLHSGVGPGSYEYAGHPTQKPVNIMSGLVQMFPGTVADPFAGSGSTLVAAKLLGRQAVGVEIEERYCEIAANRLAQGVLAL